MQISILGATGQVGKATLKAALSRGYQVKVLVRSPEKLGDLKEQVTIVEGNLLNSASVEQALTGSVAVVNAAGGVKEPGQYEKFQKIGYILTDKMNELKIKRLVNISGAVMALPGEPLNLKRKLMKVFVNLAFKPMKQAQDGILPMIITNENIDWTLVRAAVISTKQGTGKILADDQQMPGTIIRLDDLGQFMIAQVEHMEWLNKAPFVASA